MADRREQANAHRLVTARHGDARPLTSHVRLHFLPLRPDAREHDLATQRHVAERLAALLGCRFEGSIEASAVMGEAAYLVPNDTLTSLADARRLGVRSEADLFGGVVPAPFVATKTITHALVSGEAVAPDGWRPDFARRIRQVVLPGHSAFTASDARIAGRRLLQDGPVRIKMAGGIGGSGQRVAHDDEQLDAGLVALDADRLACEGIVIERNLMGGRTYSIGLLHVGSMRASYYGTQRTTRNRCGEEVYGGSSLTVVRGGFDALERLAADDLDVRLAVSLAQVYHTAALECFAGMFCSRCNYDVVQGEDAGGRSLMGVLEQSWRIGGASGAEVAAMQALHDDPALQLVRASTVEVHGPLFIAPPSATVSYAGVDPHVGPITKYVQVHPHADARTAD